MRKLQISIITLLILLFSTTTIFASSNTVVTDIEVKNTNITLTEGQYGSVAISYCYMGKRPEVSDFDWKSSNTNIATVSNRGLIKAKKSGKVKITIEYEDVVETCDVTVNPDKPVVVNTKDCYTHLNNYRKAFNKGKKKSKQIPILKKDKNLEKLALIRAKEMATTGKFSHTRPNGKKGLSLIKGNKHKGENIAMGQRTCKEVTVAWYNSKGHRDNMLRKPFKKVGIAAYKYKGVTYWCQLFSS